MAERIHRVTLTADVSGFKRGMDDAATATKKVGSSAEETESKSSAAFGKAGKWIGTALVGGAGLAAKAVIDLGLSYEQSLNSMQAVTGATADEMARVSATAKALGNDIKIPGASASDAAEAMTELAKGGLSVDQALAAARGTLQLATAAQISGAEAATIQADALNAFNLEAGDAGHVADVLANAANAATGDIGDFGAGLAQSAAVAHSMGVSLDDTTTMLGLFANAGVKGSDAGTSLKTMFTQLQNPSEKARGAMEELGLSVYDAQGNFIGMRAVVDQLSKAQGTMSQEAFNAAAGTVFGSDAIRGATIVAEGGVAAYDKMSGALGKVGGASALAAAQSQGVTGALNNVKNQLENVALSVFERVSPALEGLFNTASDVLPAVGGFFATVVEGAAGFAGFMADLPGPVLAAGAALGTIAILKNPISSVFETVAKHIEDFSAKVDIAAGSSESAGEAVAGVGEAVAPVGDALEAAGVSSDTLTEGLTGAVDKAKETRAASEGPSGGLRRMGAAARVAGAGLLSAFGGPVGIAILAITTAVSFLSTKMHELDGEAVDLTGSIDDQTGKWVANAAAAVGATLAQGHLTEKLAAQGVTQEQATDALLKGSDAIDGITAKLQAQVDAARAAADANSYYNTEGILVVTGSAELDAATIALNSWTDTVGAAGSAVREAGVKGIDAATWTDKYSRAMAGTAKASEEAKQPITDMAGLLKDSADAASAADDAVKYFNLSVNQMLGIDTTAEEATKLLNDAVRDTAAAFKDAQKETKNHAEALINAKGQIDTTTAAGSALYDNLRSISDAYDVTTTAAYNNAVESGNSAGAMDKARAAADGARAKFLEQAAAMGINRDKALLLADGLGIVEGKKLTDKNFAVNAQNIPETNIALAKLDAKQIANKYFKITADIVAGRIGVGADKAGAAAFSAAGLGFAEGGRVGYAAGGPLGGTPPATPGVDNLLARGPGGNLIGLRSGEWVIRQESADHYGPQIMAAINAGVIPRQRLSGGLADGGRYTAGIQRDMMGGFTTSGRKTQVAEVVNITTQDPDVESAINAVLFRMPLS